VRDRNGDGLAFLACVIASGDVIQSALAPAGPHAAAIHQLWQLLLWTSAAVFAIVIAFIAAALVRSARRPPGSPAATERTLYRGVVAGVIATAAILIGLLAASAWTTRALTFARAESAVSIQVIGHQWWWEIEYEDAVASRRVLTANELHVPLHRPVVVKVASRDVIHSFWVPNLQGKRDLIPGMTTAIFLQADRAGRYRGQCAEFCGLEHANMAFDVVAESDGDFERWLDAMRAPAVPPSAELERRGLELFTTERCGRCHTIRGTDANGQVAPDLTHVASRLTIAAGTLPNTPEHRRSWIENPQAVKPGNQMPATPLPEDAMTALVTYLGTLR
jgi:cytochrome c oxidase subunit 2